MLSTFPPTECGIATFAAALSAGIIAAGGEVDVVRIGSTPAIEDASVVGYLAVDKPQGVLQAVGLLSRSDVTIVQHEYGIYPGPDGDGVVPLLEALTGPTIVVAHTVLTDPSTRQRSILERICRVADAVVVMTETARRRLIDRYDVDGTQVSVIAHGAATPSAGAVGADLERGTEGRAGMGAAPRLLTWGLLGPGKGIEWAIDAMGALTDLDPRPRYVIAGATHPKVIEHNGEAYREMLVARAAASPAAELVSFDATYRDLPSLHGLIHSADVVVLPYDSTEQVTSGVLVDAVAAGRPVVSTSFPHACELLASGAGIVVPQQDPAALAAALRAVLSDPVLAAGMAAEARRLSPNLSWTTVARQYGALAEELIEFAPACADGPVRV